MKKQSGFTLIELLIVVAVIALLAIFFLGGPLKTRAFGQGKMVEALHAQGYTDVEYLGYSWLGCADSDTFRAKFRATSPQGAKVEGIACSGYIKGTTIRW